MKKKISFVLLLISSIINRAYTQTGIKLDYAFYDITGNNISLSISKVYMKKHYFSGGLKFHINDPLRDVPLIFTRQLQSQNFIENFGLTAEYRRLIKLNPSVYFYPFYNFQFTRKSPIVPAHVLDFSTGVYFDTVLVFKPINYWDNAMGVGFEFKLSRKMKFNLNAGVGVTFPFLYDNSFFGSGKITYEFIKMFSGGISYTLSEYKKPLRKKT